MRYQLILDECEATDKKYWGKVLCSGKSILDLWDQPQWGWLDWNQEWHVVDTRRGKTLSEEEFRELGRRLYNEKASP